MVTCFTCLCSTRTDAMKLVTVDQMRRIEAASDAQGHTYAQMMERAGSAVARVIQSRLDLRDQRILVLVGSGNNGGDGLVAARYLHDAGAEIGVYLLKSRTDEHLSTLRQRGVFIAVLADDQGLRVLREWADSCAVLVDALLGTGVSRSISNALGSLLGTINEVVRARRTATADIIIPSQPTARAHSPLIVAVDGPTGLNYDTGELDPVALPADLSVTFAYPKVGHTRFPGASACGELYVADIGTDPALATDIELELADPALIRSLLPARPRDAHKGTFGKVLIVSGSTLYTGAPILAAEAAYRAGAGLVTLATPRSIHAIMASKINEATFLPLPDRDGVISEEAAPIIHDKLSEYTVTLIGPGLTTQAHNFLDKVLDQAAGQLVLDADALNILAQIDHWWSRVPGPAILTPHPGEMARLTKLSLTALEADRGEIAIGCAQRWGHVVVLKGAFTVIAAPDGRSLVLPFANPALATAGSGDVLAGTIASMRAQGLAAFEAALCGAYLHGVAGEIARCEIGAAGVLAGDLLSRLPRVLATLA
jgi:ADP-dependent NAD(P)H-hydrate dehydratase / NAD(P)H-hydrate epimerase